MKRPTFVIRKEKNERLAVNQSINKKKVDDYEVFINNDDGGVHGILAVGL